MPGSLKCTSLFIFYLCLQWNIMDAHICSHHKTRAFPDGAVYKGRIHHASRDRRSTVRQLLIFPYFDFPSETQEVRILKQVVSEAVSFWQNTISITDPLGIIKLQRRCENGAPINRAHLNMSLCNGQCADSPKCGTVTIPSTHLDYCYLLNGSNVLKANTSGPGVEADIILYISVLPGSQCEEGSTIAYAGVCQQEPVLDRPSVGYINFCPEKLSKAEEDLPHLISYAKHEVLHVLGFSASMYAFYHDSSGLPLTARDTLTGLPEHFNKKTQVFEPSDKVLKKIVRTDWKVRGGVVKKNIRVIVLPKVKIEAQKYFNCSILEGAELEDYHGTGTGVSHWEERVFMDEMMTGGSSGIPGISRVTLALMEDTGWYIANYSQATEEWWGRNAGCDFVLNSCKHWMDSRRARRQSVQPFCDNIRGANFTKTVCSSDHSAITSCNLQKYQKKLPQQYQYFDHLPNITEGDLQFFGGSSAFADYCPYNQNFVSFSSEHTRPSICKLPSSLNTEINYLLEIHGPQSYCLEHVAPWTVKYCNEAFPTVIWGAGCYNMLCSNTTGLIIELAESHRYSCGNDHEILNISITTKEWLHQGTIVCPKCSDICGPMCTKPYITDQNNPHMTEIPCVKHCLEKISCVAALSVAMLVLIVCVLIIIRCACRYYKYRTGGPQAQYSAASQG